MNDKEDKYWEIHYEYANKRNQIDAYLEQRVYEPKKSRYRRTDNTRLFLDKVICAIVNPHPKDKWTITKIT